MKMELKPTNQKSFYGKAKILDNGKTLTLLSYDTVVAIYDKESETIELKKYYSRTTGKHVNAFVTQLGFKAVDKKDYINGTTLTK